MASVAKFKLSDSPRLLSHCNRTQKKLGEHIDMTRTPNNFNLAHRRNPDKTDYQFAKSRVFGDGVRMLNRDNVNAICSWVITLPKDMCHESVGGNGEGCFAPNDPDECRLFFQCAYNFFAEKHGEENVVSAYVHMDENCPHMHFIFTPIVPDKKRGGFKVSAKEALQDCYGMELQMKLQDYITKNMGREINMVKKTDIDYARNVKQLKKQTLNAKCASLARQAKRAEEELEHTRRSIRILQEAGKEAPETIRTTSSNGFTVMRDADWAFLQKRLKSLNSISAERDATRRELEDLETMSSVAENQRLQEENSILKEQLKTLSGQNDSLRLEIMGMREFMESTWMKGCSMMEAYRSRDNLDVDLGHGNR